MKQYLLLLSFITLSLASCVKDRVATASTGPVSVGDRKMIHYWSFNSALDSTSVRIPDTTIGGGTISWNVAAAGYIDIVSPGCTYNLRMGRDSGNGFRVRNPYYSWTLHIPTTGYKQPILQYAVQKSNSGPASNAISYTIDGTHYVSDGLASTSTTISTTWTQYSFDFTGISGVDDNPKFAVRFTNSDTTAGNSRYDNISVDAYTK